MKRFVTRTFCLVTGLLVLAGMDGCSTRVGGAHGWAFRDAGGDVRTISEYKGGVVVLAFTNSWCDSCHEAALHMQDLQQRYADRGVRIVYVASWEHGDPSDYMEENGYTYGLMLNGTQIAREHKVNRIPTFAVMDGSGRIASRIEGFNKNTPAKLAKAIDKQIKRSGQYTATADR